MSFVFLAVNGHLIPFSCLYSLFLSRVDLQEAVGRALGGIERVLLIGNVWEPKSGELRAVVNTEIVKNLTFFVQNRDKTVFGGLLVVKPCNKELPARVHSESSRSESARELVEHGGVVDTTGVD